jgi:hydroxysqualene dehydroxylase
MSHIHVIGAGLAGLSAAITATGMGHEVTLYEATGAGGGRCRSYFDTELGIRLDNGNHLLLSGNEAALSYIREIGALDRISGPGRPIFPFMDLTTGRKWTLRPSLGRIPWWLLFPNRRVPKTTVREYLPLRAIGREWDGTVMTETIPHRALYRSLLEPLSIAALNTRPHEALACLFGAVLRETLLKGGKACLPLLPKQGLSELLVEPAIETLRKRGADILFSRRISGVATGHGRAAALETGEGKVVLGSDEAVVLAVPPWIAAELLPGTTVPDAFESILNVHFKLTIDPREVSLGDVAEAGFIGLVNGTAEWVFIRRDHVSVTVSAANQLIDRRADDLAIAIWGDVAKALNLDAREVPPFRVIKERRATIVANATQEARRPGARTDIENLALAGDWTDTRLPGTIEGAIRSGVTAVQAIFNMPGMVSKGPMRSLASHDA